MQIVAQMESLKFNKNIEIMVVDHQHMVRFLYIAPVFRFLKILMCLKVFHSTPIGCHLMS